MANMEYDNFAYPYGWASQPHDNQFNYSKYSGNQITTDALIKQAYQQGRIDAIAELNERNKANQANTNE